MIKYLPIIAIFLTSCGGGSSSSGGGQQAKNLTFCVSATSTETVSTIASQGITITRLDHVWANHCGEVVNLTTATSLSIVETVELPVGGTHSSSSLLPLNHVACIPPSVGVDGDPDRPLVQLDCS